MTGQEYPYEVCPCCLAALNDVVDGQTFYGCGTWRIGNATERSDECQLAEMAQRRLRRHIHDAVVNDPRERITGVPAWVVSTIMGASRV